MRNRCVQIFEPRMDTDEHGWVRRFFNRRKGREGRGYEEGRIHSPSVGVCAERNRCVQIVNHGWTRMNTDGYAGFLTEGKEGKEGVTRRGEFIRPGWVRARSATGACRL